MTAYLQAFVDTKATPQHLNEEEAGCCWLVCEMLRTGALCTQSGLSNGVIVACFTYAACSL
jgi:hypothetical protein